MVIDSLENPVHNTLVVVYSSSMFDRHANSVVVLETSLAHSTGHEERNSNLLPLM